jgi:hypothetical protein
MTSSTTTTAEPGPGQPVPRKGVERLLVFIVAFLGLLIVAGIAAVVLKIFYLSSGPVAQPASSAGGGTGPPAAVSSQAVADPKVPDRLVLPAGAVVRSISLAGDRMAVHYESPSESGVAILDLATGAVVRRVQIVPGEAKP